MSDFKYDDPLDAAFAEEHFDIRHLQDEIRVDDLCSRLLKFFYLDLVGEQGKIPEQASALAYGADYFLREFVIPDRRENIFRLAAGRVRQFAGNWYIVKTLEPNMTELEDILRGVAAFYDYCHRVNKVATAVHDAVARECADLPYYRQRIESFWAIEGDGYLAWDKECPLRD